MKKLTVVILILSLALSLCACTKANDSAPSAPAASTPAPASEAASTQAAQEPVQNVTINFATPTVGEEADIKFDEPIVILDNEYAKITITGKYAGADDTTLKQVYGYKAIVENKTTNKYLMISIPFNISIDGFMLDQQAGFFGTVQNYAPSTKANVRFYIYQDRAQSVELNSIDDLKNVNGAVQIMYSDDGQQYTGSPDGSFQLNNQFPFLTVIP